MEQQNSRSDSIISRIKNNRVAALVIVLGTVIIALATFTNAVNNLLRLTPANRPAQARIELSRLSLEYTVDAFLEAAAKGDLHAVKLFLAAGMDPNAQNTQGFTALRRAIRGGHARIVRTLVEAKAIAHEFDLSWAAERKNGDILRILLESRAPTKETNKAFLTAAHLGHLQQLKVLRKRGVGVDVITIALRAAASRGKGASDQGQNEVVNFLLALGADINGKNKHGLTALHYATRSGFVAVTRTLVEQGAEPNARREGAWTPLFDALYLFNGYPRDEESLQIVNILLARGADVNAKDSQGKTPLMIAANFRNAKIIRVLLDAGARVHEHDDAGRTVFSFVEHNHKDKNDIIHLLQKAKAPLQAIRENSGT